MINIGVIGCGQWGPNHIRNFTFLKDANVTMCCDLNKKRLTAIKELYPHTEATTDYHDILKNKLIDALVVSTPTVTHFEIVKASLDYGKDVLCEKPLTVSIDESEELVELAEQKNRILMIGHVFMFNSGIQMLRGYIKSRFLGKIYYIQTARTNLGPFRSDVNVVWDLASHDISIVSYLLGSDPIRVTAKGEVFLQEKIEDVAFISLDYPNNIFANIHVSWLDPRKVREITVVGDERMVVWNDMSNVAPIKIYDKGIEPKQYYDDFGEFQLSVREGDITIPKIDLVEPLKAQSIHFLECVKNRTNPISDGNFGLKVIKVMDSIQHSMNMDGGSVPIPSETLIKEKIA